MPPKKQSALTVEGLSPFDGGKATGQGTSPNSGDTMITPIQSVKHASGTIWPNDADEGTQKK